MNQQYQQYPPQQHANPYNPNGRNPTNDLEANLLQENGWEPYDPAAFEARDNSQNDQNNNGIPVDFRSNLMYSMKFNVLHFLIVLGKIVAAIAVLVTSNFHWTFKQIWIGTMLFHDEIYLVAIVITMQLIRRVNSLESIQGVEPAAEGANENGQPNNQGNSPQRSPEQVQNRPQESDRNPPVVENGPPVMEIVRSIARKKRLIAQLVDFTDTCYFFIFLAGNVIYFLSPKEETNSAETNLMLAFILMGYLWVSAPILLVILACLCLPVLLILIYYFGGRGSQVPAKRNIINNLPVMDFDQSLPGEHSCPICIVDYNAGDKIIQLRCNPQHHFHEACIKHWLEINGQCPICRAKIEG